MAVAVGAAHREAAFSAARWLIDQLKEQVSHLEVRARSESIRLGASNMMRDGSNSAPLSEASPGSHQLHPLWPAHRPLGRAPEPSFAVVDSFGAHSSIAAHQCHRSLQHSVPILHARSRPVHGQCTLLSLPEIAQFVRVVATLGIRKVRITGGEPLMRPNLASLISEIGPLKASKIGADNQWHAAADQIAGLVDCRLKRINISLDTLRTRHSNGCPDAMASIACWQASRPRSLSEDLVVKLNALVIGMSISVKSSNWARFSLAARTWWSAL